MFPVDLTRLYRKYKNKWVALTDDNRVITYGEDPENVLKQAEKKGYKDPVITRIPDPNCSYVF